MVISLRGLWFGGIASLISGVLGKNPRDGWADTFITTPAEVSTRRLPVALIANKNEARLQSVVLAMKAAGVVCTDYIIIEFVYVEGECIGV